MEKANMMFLSKEGTEKGHSLKTQMILTTSNQTEKATENVWRKMVILKMKRLNLT